MFWNPEGCWWNMGNYVNTGNAGFVAALKDYGGEMLLVGINYDVKSKKHTCRIEKLER